MDWSRRETWLATAVYALLLSAPLSIVGVGGATMLLFLLVVYHRIRQPVQDPLPAWVLAAFVLIPATAAVSALANPDPWRNLAHLRKEYAIFLPLALVPALSFVDRRRLLLIYAIPVCAAAIYGVIQYHWGVDWLRPEGAKLITPAREPGSTVFHGKGTFSHHLTFVGFMAMNVPFFLSLAIQDKTRARYVFAFAFVMASAGTLVSLGRSGWLGAASGLLLLLLGFPRRTLLPLGALLVLLLVAGWTVYGGFLKVAIPSEHQPGFVKRLTMTSAQYDRERIYIWQSALLGIQDRPVLGVGYGNDRKYTPEYRRAISRETGFRFKIGPTTHAHNVYLQVAFELGLAGLAAFLYLWVVAFRWNRMWVAAAGDSVAFDRALLAGASCALAVAMVAGLFENNFFDAEVRTLILVMIGISLHAGLRIRGTVGGASGEAAHASP